MRKVFSYEGDRGFRVVDVKPFFLAWASLPDVSAVTTSPLDNHSCHQQREGYLPVCPQWRQPADRTSQSDNTPFRCIFKRPSPQIHLGLSPWNCYLGWEELSSGFSWKYFNGGCYYLGSRVAQEKDRIISMETQPLTLRPLPFPSLHCISLKIIMTLALQNGCGD